MHVLSCNLGRPTRRDPRHRPPRSTDAAVRKLLGDLAKAEAGHERTALEAEATRLPGAVRAWSEDASRRFILQVIQPGLVGLMDGSVSTLAPVFATHDPWNAFLVGLAASFGAGISMGFAEALADNGKLSGRGTPLLRGLVCRVDDDRRRHRPNDPLPHPELHNGDGGRRGRGAVRTAGDRLDPAALH